MNNNRRTVLKGMAISPFLLSGENTNPEFDMEAIKRDIPEKMTILFQGDSITDAGRDRAAYYPNQTAGMGNGYVYQIAFQLLGRHAEKGLRIYNRGVSGHRVPDLLERWRDDCLQLRPNVLSLLIGVNDFWHTLDGKYEGSTENFSKNLRYLIKRTLAAKEDTKLIIGEPFAVKGGSFIDEKWEKFTAYQTIVREMAEEFEATLLPYQEIFDEALEEAPAEYWCPDGVHPSMAGAYLMSNAWLKAFYRIFI